MLKKTLLEEQKKYFVLVQQIFEFSLKMAKLGYRTEIYIKQFQQLGDYKVHLKSKEKVFKTVQIVTENCVDSENFCFVTKVKNKKLTDVDNDKVIFAIYKNVERHFSGTGFVANSYVGLIIVYFILFTKYVSATSQMIRMTRKMRAKKWSGNSTYLLSKEAEVRIRRLLKRAREKQSKYRQFYQVILNYPGRDFEIPSFDALMNLIYDVNVITTLYDINYKFHNIPRDDK